jgi:hypothetical protein
MKLLFRKAFYRNTARNHRACRQAIESKRKALSLKQIILAINLCVLGGLAVL